MCRNPQPYRGGRRILTGLFFGCACSFIFTFRTHLNLLGVDLGFAASVEKGVTIAELIQQDDDYASAMEKKNAKKTDTSGTAGDDAGEKNLLLSYFYVKRTPVAGENDDDDKISETTGTRTNQTVDEKAAKDLNANSDASDGIESNQDDKNVQNMKDLAPKATGDILQNDEEKESNISIDETNESSSNVQKMNILLLYPDDWRWNSLGAENPIIQTPFLDSLAQEGIRFRQNAVTTSICWQSRATLFSGQWASRHRSFKLKCPHFTKGETWNQTWVGMLRKDGYHTGHIGKWQYWNNDLKKRWDFHHGFEGRHWYNHDRKEFTGDELASHSALEFLQKRPKDKPFSLSIAFYPPKPVGNSRDPVSMATAVVIDQFNEI